MQIGEYEVENLTTKNAGFSKWGFAVKEGKTYFIKEFLSPVYPVSGKLSEKQIGRKKKIVRRMSRRCGEYMKLSMDARMGIW